MWMFERFSNRQRNSCVFRTCRALTFLSCRHRYGLRHVWRDAQPNHIAHVRGPGHPARHDLRVPGHGGESAHRPPRPDGPSRLRSLGRRPQSREAGSHGAEPPPPQPQVRPRKPQQPVLPVLSNSAAKSVWDFRLSVRASVHPQEEWAGARASALRQRRIRQAEAAPAVWEQRKEDQQSGDSEGGHQIHFASERSAAWAGYEGQGREGLAEGREGSYVEHSAGKQRERRHARSAEKAQKSDWRSGWKWKRTQEDETKVVKTKRVVFQVSLVVDFVFQWDWTDSTESSHFTKSMFSCVLYVGDEALKFWNKLNTLENCFLLRDYLIIFCENTAGKQNVGLWQGFSKRWSGTWVADENWFCLGISSWKHVRLCLREKVLWRTKRGKATRNSPAWSVTRMFQVGTQIMSVSCTVLMPLSVHSRLQNNTTELCRAALRRCVLA